MTSRTLQPESVRHEYAELARLCADAVRALRASPANTALLTTALERVELLLAEAREELVATVRDLQSLHGAAPPAKREATAEPALLRAPAYVPWG
jgi:hypothetical protein